MQIIFSIRGNVWGLPPDELTGKICRIAKRLLDNNKRQGKKDMEDPNEKKIRFTVWNISGPKKKPSETSKETPLWEQRVRSILWDDQNVNSDFVFLQEIPNPMKTKLNKKFLELNPPVWYDWHSATKEENYFRGIMLYRKTFNPEITIVPLKTPDPKLYYIGQAYSIKVKGSEKLRFIGFWNVRQIPGRNTQTQILDADHSHKKQDYYSLLTAFLETVLPTDVPCIIAGDTNVCISSKGIDGKEATDCPDRKKLVNFLTEKKLVLINGEAGKSPVLETMTYCHLKKKLFRCDLLIASESLWMEGRIRDISIGEPKKYMECAICPHNNVCTPAANDQGEYSTNSSGSDHLPLFFSYSYDNGSDNKV